MNRTGHYIGGNNQNAHLHLYNNNISRINRRVEEHKLCKQYVRSSGKIRENIQKIKNKKIVPRSRLFLRVVVVVVVIVFVRCGLSLFLVQS